MDPTLRTILYSFRFRWCAAAPRVLRILLAFAIAFIPLYMINSGRSEAYEPMLLRSWFQERGKRPVPQTVSIVKLDKRAYAKINLSPGELFPRKSMAEGIRKIAAAGAKLIVLDAVAQRPSADPNVDRELAKTFASTPTVIMQSSETVVDNDIFGNRHSTKLYNKNIELFGDSAQAIIQSHVRLTDGVVREICLSNDRDVFSADRLPLLEPLRKFVTPGIPEPGGFDFINYYGPPSYIPSVSFAELIGPTLDLPPEFFLNRVVFIGSHSDSGTGAEAGKDSFLTPVSADWMFGVEIHATIAANLLDDSWIRRLPPLAAAALQVFLLFVAALAILNLGMLPAIALALSLISSCLVASYLAFAKFNLFLPAIVLCGSIFLVLVLRLGLAGWNTRQGRTA